MAGSAETGIGMDEAASGAAQSANALSLLYLPPSEMYIFTLRLNFREPLGAMARKNSDAALVARHSGFDWSIPSQLRTGMSSGATRISMLRGTPG